MADHLLQQTKRLPPRQHNYFNGLRHFQPSLPNNIICFRRTNNFHAALKSQHHRFVLVVNLKGNGTVFLNRQAIPLSSNHGLLIFPHQTHSYAAPRRLLWLFITFELEHPDWLQPLHNVPVQLSKPCAAMLADLLQCYLRQREIPECGFRCALSLGWVLHTMLASLDRHSSQAPGIIKSRQEMLVENINRYIYEHLGTRLTIQTIARALGLSPSHLRALFRKKLKISLGSYIRNIRFDKAIEMLTGTDRLIKEIASATGFASTASFITTFQRLTGTTPSRYRQQLKAPATTHPNPGANRRV